MTELAGLAVVGFIWVAIVYEWAIYYRSVKR